LGLISHGAGHGFHGGGNRGVCAGAAVPAMLRGDHTRELSMATRPGSTRQAHVRCRFGRSAVLPLIWVLFQSAFLGPHVVGLRFDGSVSLPMWDRHVLLGIRLSHWLVLIF
jgi:hypothetical protein